MLYLENVTMPTGILFMRERQFYSESEDTFDFTVDFPKKSVEELANRLKINYYDLNLL
jgi:hypothetical protein